MSLVTYYDLDLDRDFIPAQWFMKKVLPNGTKLLDGKLLNTYSIDNIKKAMLLRKERIETTHYTPIEARKIAIFRINMVLEAVAKYD